MSLNEVQRSVSTLFAVPQEQTNPKISLEPIVGRSGAGRSPTGTSTGREVAKGTALYDAVATVYRLPSSSGAWRAR
jgi:hypothetical protein